MTMTESVADSVTESVFSLSKMMNSVFSKDLGLSYKHESFTIDGSDGIRAGVCF